MKLEDKIDVFVWREHYADHINPLWEAIPREYRGNYYVSEHQVKKGKYKLPESEDSIFVKNPYELIDVLTPSPRLMIVPTDRSGFLSLIPRPLARIAHGVAQTYKDEKIPDRNREQVILDLLPNEYSREKFSEKFPVSDKIVAGCPKMDRWCDFSKSLSEPPVVAISFHFNHKAVPETRGTYPHYQSILPKLAQSNEWELLGHGHPRFIDELIPKYEELGINYTRDFEEVMKQADVYACDSPSTLYEFAYTDRPVVVLNAPWFRREVEHGLRFWEHADVGIQCDKPEDLPGTIRKALKDEPPQPSLRRKAVNAAYAVTDGSASETMAKKLVDFVKKAEVEEKLLISKQEELPGFSELLNRAVNEGKINPPVWLAPQGLVTRHISKEREFLDFAIEGILDRDPRPVEGTEEMKLLKYQNIPGDLEGTVLITSDTWGEEIEEKLVDTGLTKGKIINFFDIFEEQKHQILLEIHQQKEINESV